MISEKRKGITMGEENKKLLGAAAFAPMIVFMVLYIGCGIYFTIAGGVDRPWSQIPREAAIFVGIVLSFVMCRSISLNKKVDAFMKNAGASGVMMMVLIFLLAGAFSQVAKSSGASDSLVNLGLSLVPGNFMLPGIFVVSAVIATAMGTSSGTIVLIAPVAMAVAQQMGASIPLYFSAAVGGAFFGDNLSFISDTTIAACNGAGCEMKDKFRMNFSIALPAAILTVIVYGIVGSSSGAVIEHEMTWSLVNIIPYIFVLVAAFAGMNVMAVLISGVLLAGFIGLVTGNLTFVTLAQAIGSGMSSMASMSILCMLLSGLVGVVQLFGGINWLVTLIRNHIKSRKGAELAIGLLSGLLDFALLANTLSIVITSTISRELSDEYGIAPKRNASIMDIFACSFLGFMPHATYMFTLTGFYPDLNPLDMIKSQYYCLFLLMAVLGTIVFGLGRTEEEKGFKRRNMKND